MKRRKRRFKRRYEYKQIKYGENDSEENIFRKYNIFFVRGKIFYLVGIPSIILTIPLTIFCFIQYLNGNMIEGYICHGNHFYNVIETSCCLFVGFCMVIGGFWVILDLIQSSIRIIIHEPLRTKIAYSTLLLFLILRAIADYTRSMK